MSYRVDIPTLSANEVYTLTFEYEGTETIQLIVGDLTLETTDRRVVFTTTSPVNYIESNVNLTNLNIYEGYYESDDFGGEYTKESYIEGKSLVNLYDPNIHYKQNNTNGLSFNNSSYFQKTITEDGFINCKILNADAINSSGSAWQQLRTYSTMSQGNTDVFTVILFLRKNNVKTTGLTVKFGYGHASYDVTEIVKGDIDPSSGSIDIPTGQIGIYHAVVKRGGYSSRVSLDYYANSMEIGFSGDWQNGELEYSWVVLEGDHHDEIVNGEINYFTGIGCVKSPTIKSLSPENLYVSPLKYREPLRGYEYYHNDGTVEIYPNGSGAYSTIDLYTGKDVGLSYLGSPKTWYVNNGIKLGLGAGTYYFHCEIELIANKQITDFTGRPQVDVIYDEAQYFGIISSNFTETYDGEKYYYKGVYGASYKTVADDIRGIYVGIWSYGISGVEKYVIRNITLTKEASLKDICAISKSSMITTPDDLELYAIKKGQGVGPYSNQETIDTLDLTTGIVTKNLRKSYHDTFNGEMRGEYYKVKVGSDDLGGKYHPCLTNREMTQVGYSAALPQDGKVYYYTYLQMLLIGCSTWTSVDDAQAWLDSGNGLYLLYPTPLVETIQLDINTLKSYRNGLIQTSSQQLAPTLKTTLPISNKFTTTNLTSGSTYNVYFDGTATELDAGGTIITNPVSPCEVECGGTTLTIEGTDIQNVRVLETTVKNEVGSVCGTTDVELSGVRCVQGGIPNLLSTLSTDWENGTDYSVCIRYKYGIDVRPNEKYVFTISKLTNNGYYKEIAIWNTDKWVSDAESIITTQRLTPNTPYIFTVPSGVTKVYIYFPYDSSGNLNQAHEHELRMQKGTVDLGYGGQKEATIPLVCNLEQPIKLRSLGTTYDSYNPATGELIKRIGVSETDGSYSVLSNPIVNQVEIDNIPHLYTNGQVKVYSDSEVYPTTILNGQSTNNYEINELSTSNNYTIRYDGECESINLNGKSNEQGTNRIVKTSTNGSGNLTFVNNSEDIDNVLLVEHDVREQEINLFNGLQTVEISGMLIENQGNMWWNDWITPSEYGASWQVDSPEFISVEPGETIYVIANNNSYTSLFEFDENYNIVNQGKDLILSNEANPKPMNLGNNYYKNYRILSDNTRYIKFTIPASTASTAKSETRWSIISFTKTDVGNVPLYTNNTPYRGSIINLPQPVQLNSLLDGTHDTYNPITGEYIQNVGYLKASDATIGYFSNTTTHTFTIRNSTITNPPILTSGWATYLESSVLPRVYNETSFGISQNNVSWYIGMHIPKTMYPIKEDALQWILNNVIILYKAKEPITTQLTPINIPTFEGGILQLITTDGKVFPMIEYSMPTNNRYDTSSWEVGAVYTQRNMTEVYFNDSTTPMTPTETMTLTTDHISSGSIILNDNGNGLIVLNGDYTGRDIPYFTGMRSVEAIEVETTPSPDQPLFGKGGRK